MAWYPVAETSGFYTPSKTSDLLRKVDIYNTALKVAEMIHMISPNQKESLELEKIEAPMYTGTAADVREAYVGEINRIAKNRKLHKPLMKLLSNIHGEKKYEEKIDQSNVIIIQPPVEFDDPDYNENIEYGSPLSGLLREE